MRSRLALALLVLCPLLLAAAPVRLLSRLSHGVTTSSMGLVLPDPGSTPGPSWATLLNAALTAVDAHDHTPGKGVQVPSAGVLHNADEAWNTHRSTGLRGLTFAGSLPIDNRVLTLSVAGSDLWFEDGNGNQIPITCSGAMCIPNAAGFGGNYATDPAGPVANYFTATKDYSFTTNGSSLGGVKFGRFKPGFINVSSSPYTITDTDTAAVVLVDTSGARTVILPSASTNAQRVLWFKDSTGGASPNTITVTRSGSATIDGATSKQITTAYGSLRIYCDGSNWFTL